MRHQPFHRHVTAPSVSTHPKQKTPARSKPNEQEALAGSRHWLGGRNGPEQNRAASCGISYSKGTSQPPASPVSTHPKQGNPSKIQAHWVATWSAEPLLFGTFEPLKSKGGRVKQGALASSRHWLGERNGPEQHRAASAIPKARHSHSPIREHASETKNPSKIQTQRIALGRQSRCR